MDIQEGTMEDRSRFKMEVYRASKRHDQITPRCCWCNKPVGISSFECHEALVKRSNIPTKSQAPIMVHHNCVPLHVKCHQEHGHDRMMKARALGMLSRIYSSTKIGYWYKDLREKYSLSLPRGLLLPPGVIKAFKINQMIEAGSVLIGIELPEASWDLDLNGKTWDFRSAVWARYARKRGHSKLKPPREMNGVTVETMMKIAREGYWLDYMAGIVTSTLREVIAEVRSIE